MLLIHSVMFFSSVAPTEFDFDDDFGSESASAVTPRRTPGLLFFIMW